LAVQVGPFRTVFLALSFILGSVRREYNVLVDLSLKHEFRALILILGVQFSAVLWWQNDQNPLCGFILV